MAKITMLFGVLLIAISLAIWLCVDQVRSISIFIPAFVGLPLTLLGVGAAQAPDLRKHFMHGAVLIGLLGGLAALGRGIPQVLKVIRGEAVETLPLVSVWSMAILCFIYVGLCVQSFIAARRARQGGESA